MYVAPPDQDTPLLLGKQACLSMKILFNLFYCIYLYSLSIPWRQLCGPTVPKVMTTGAPVVFPKVRQFVEVFVCGASLRLAKGVS